MPVTPLLEAPTPLVGDSTPQRLGELVVAVLAVAGDRAEVALQTGPDVLEARQASGPRRPNRRSPPGHAPGPRSRPRRAGLRGSALAARRRRHTSRCRPRGSGRPRPARALPEAVEGLRPPGSCASSSGRRRTGRGGCGRTGRRGRGPAAAGCGRCAGATSAPAGGRASGSASSGTWSGRCPSGRPRPARHPGTSGSGRSRAVPSPGKHQAM